MSDADDAALLAGRYRVIRRLGTGGMARVDLAEDIRLGREVAIKRMHSGRADDDARRFAREARLGATLNHPNLVTVFDAISEGDTVLIVMEYVDGTDLSALLEAGRPLGDEEALRILDRLAAAIDHAHEHDIVHRDVKPSNVLIRDDGVVKLVDMGIARALEDTAITGSGTVLGSLPYIAPEALRGEDIGAEADVYSLALIAYEALTGRKARREGTVPQVTHQAINEPPPELRDVRPDLPPAASKVLARALDPEPSRRPASASAFVRDLKDAVATGGSAPEPTAATAEVTPLPAAEEAPAESPPPSRVFEPPPTIERDRGRPWALIAVGSLLAIGAIVVFAVLVLGGGSAGSDSGGQAGGAAKSAAGGGGPDGGSGGSAAATATPSSPDGAVEAFYQRAAAGDYSGAWELADSNFRAQLGSFEAFEAQQSTLESIEFPTIDVTSESGPSATVSFSTVATHTSFVDRCNGTMTLVSTGGDWVIDKAESITCDRS